MDCSLPGSSVHGILQARILEWVAMPFSRGSSQPRDWTQVYCIAGEFLTIWATSEAVTFNQSVQSLSHVWLFATPWTAAHQPSLSITNSWSLLKLISIESVMPSSHLILCHSLLLLPSIFPSGRVFSNESVLCIRWLKHWKFSFSISPSNEYSGLISFRIDWFDLLAVQGTLHQPIWSIPYNPLPSTRKHNTKSHWRVWVSWGWVSHSPWVVLWTLLHYNPCEGSVAHWVSGPGLIQ